MSDGNHTNETQPESAPAQPQDTSAQPKDAPALPEGAPEAPSPDRHAASLKERFGRLDPGKRDQGPINVRCEVVSGADALQPRLAWWRELLGTAEPANPALDPDYILPLLTTRRHILQPSFLLLWREGASDSSLRARDLIGLLPLSRGTVAGVPIRWPRTWSAGWWPAGTPLIHRRHQKTAALAVLNWLSGAPRPASMIRLEDLDADGDFARTLLSDARAKPRPRGRVQLFRRSRTENGEERSAPPPDVTTRLGRAVRRADLDAHLEHTTAWKAGEGNGGKTPRALIAARDAQLSPARAQGRLALAEASHRDSVTATALTLTTGNTASVTFAADPTLTWAERELELARALDGLLSTLVDAGAVTMVQAAPDTPREHARGLTSRRRLVDVVIFAGGVVGRALAAGNALGMRRRRASPARPRAISR